MTCATRRILFRADSTAEIGAGHLMRCLGLAQYLADLGIEVELATVAPNDGFVDLWREENIPVHDLQDVLRGSVEDARKTAALASGAPVVLDGYDFGISYTSGLRRASGMMAMFDDLNDRSLDADLVINQNAGADQRFKYDPPAGRTLLGCRFAVMRREVRAAQHQGSGGMLVTLGGSDRDNLGLDVLRRLTGLKISMPVHLVCTAGNEGLEEARNFCAANPGFSVSAPPEILKFMCRSDVALCAGGTTSLELAYLGVPMSIVTLAENQRPGAAAVAKAGAAVASGTIEGAVEGLMTLVFDEAARRRMSVAGRSLVDGNGVKRIADALLSSSPVTH